MIEVGEDTRQTEIEQAKEEVTEEFKELHNILERYKVKMSIEEMVEQTPCYISFLEKLLQTTVALSNEDFISLSKE